jgi:large subunit ribosomal protein L13
MKTTLLKKQTRPQPKWYLIDAKDQVLGRLAVKIATLLRGRHHAYYTPHVDSGDFVVIINADKVALTGKKEQQKTYMFYSGVPGGESYSSFERERSKNPEFVIHHAVKGMLPKNKLSRHLLTKCKVYAGDTHPHAAQNPEPIKL